MRGGEGADIEKDPCTANKVPWVVIHSKQSAMGGNSGIAGSGVIFLFDFLGFFVVVLGCCFLRF